MPLFGLALNLPCGVAERGIVVCHDMDGNVAKKIRFGYKLDEGLVIKIK